MFSQAAFTELEVQDTLLGEMLEAIDRSGVRNRSTIFIVSDHGFINATQQAAPGVLLAQRGLTQDPWKAYPYSGSGRYHHPCNNIHIYIYILLRFL